MNIEQRFEQVDQRFDQVEQRFEQVDQRFEKIDNKVDDLRNEMITRFDKAEKTFATKKDLESYATKKNLDDAVDKLTRKMDNMQSSLEKKLDRMILMFDGEVSSNRKRIIRLETLTEFGPPAELA